MPEATPTTPKNPTTAPTVQDEMSPAVPIPADLSDERLVHARGVRGALDSFTRKVRGGDLGSLPVIIGLIVISLVFYAQEPTFLSSRTLVNITLFAAPIGIIAIGVVLVLLLGEIDLSVGSVSGLAASVMAVMVVYEGYSLFVSILAGALTGLAIGVLYAVLFTKVGVPSFVITLAGLLGFLGLQLVVLGKNGTVNLPPDSRLVEFARSSFVTGVASYVLVLVVAVGYGAALLWSIRRRTAAGLSAPSLVSVAVRTGLLAGGLLYLTYYLNIDRGLGYLPLLFVALVVLMDLLLRKTTWGRHVFAVGGNVEAARRSGIRVTRVYLSVFALTGLFAAIGGLLAAAQLTSVSQASGGTDTNLTAIAAAVIGGTSLFGGRGTAYAALLGIIVLQSIQTGLNVIGVDSSVRYMVTGAVLLLAVSIDSVSRRARSSSGRG
ncbi:sugar ABC transporter permease [Nocardioides sp. WL0053]|uniref:Xylose transport system permease protein XylH n=1 Tax=Nocardioides jiangsuensis TaxID=2866161 RepID=A0ABS7RQW8_9ACTN|nr:sugar ABC transporter permease [Nocardioides jiangsuensis]MBY9076315.1 sugar ABC transporter permease [Nocardioides jiangsuensis]